MPAVGCVTSSCAVACCPVLCCAVLCCAVLRCAVLRCAVLRCAVLCKAKAGLSGLSHKPSADEHGMLLKECLCVTQAHSRLWSVPGHAAH